MKGIRKTELKVNDMRKKLQKAMVKNQGDKKTPAIHACCMKLTN